MSNNKSSKESMLALAILAAKRGLAVAQAVAREEGLEFDEVNILNIARNFQKLSLPQLIATIDNYNQFACHELTKLASLVKTGKLVYIPSRFDKLPHIIPLYWKAASNIPELWIRFTESKPSSHFLSSNKGFAIFARGKSVDIDEILWDESDPTLVRLLLDPDTMPELDPEDCTISIGTNQDATLVGIFLSREIQSSAELVCSPVPRPEPSLAGKLFEHAKSLLSTLADSLRDTGASVTELMLPPPSMATRQGGTQDTSNLDEPTWNVPERPLIEPQLISWRIRLLDRNGTISPIPEEAIPDVEIVLYDGETQKSIEGGNFIQGPLGTSIQLQNPPEILCDALREELYLGVIIDKSNWSMEFGGTLLFYVLGGEKN